MEIWLRTIDGPEVASVEGIDRLFGATPHDSNLHVKDTTLFQGNNVMGAYVHVRDGTTQQMGIAHMGTVDWILVECETWSMIPLENLIAHRKDRGQDLVFIGHGQCTDSVASRRRSGER